MALIRSAPEGISRLEIQQRLGANKKRAAYALRKLEHAGRIAPPQVMPEAPGMSQRDKTPRTGAMNATLYKQS